jgi:hypothetical protein
MVAEYSVNGDTAYLAIDVVLLPVLLRNHACARTKRDSVV